MGLDPAWSRFPWSSAAARSSAARRWRRRPPACRGIVDAVAPSVVAVKPQAAFFEALGADGVGALEDVCAYARTAGLLVILDAKRGDIGSTARAYAIAYLERNDGAEPLADALTVNPYLGRDSLDPFCSPAGATARASSAS